MTRIKICCISSLDEAKIAIRNGASAIGLVSEMPSGPGVIDEKLIKTIAGFAPPGVATFLLTSKQETDAIIQQQKRCGANTIQLCDRLTKGSHRELKDAMPGVKIVQVVHINGIESLKEALELSQHVDALLLDSGNQSLEVKQLGGTGRTHDWLLSKKIIDSVTVPVYLAGGLKPANIAQAIEVARPFGVDVCSGIRSDDKLDEIKLKQFCAEVRAADFQ